MCAPRGEPIICLLLGFLLQITFANFLHLLLDHALLNTETGNFIRVTEDRGHQLLASNRILILQILLLKGQLDP